MGITSLVVGLMYVNVDHLRRLTLDPLDKGTTSLTIMGCTNAITIDYISHLYTKL